MEKGRVYLKSRFEKGDKPTQNDFRDLIDSAYNKKDDIQIGTGGGLNERDIVDLITSDKVIELLKNKLGLGNHTKPDGLQIVGFSISSIKISWTHSKTIETKYEIFRSNTKDGKYELKGEVGITTKEFIDTNVVANQIYFYKIETYDDDDRVFAVSDVISGSTSDAIISNVQIPGTNDWPWENMTRIKTFGEGLILPYKSGGWGKVATACLIPANTDFKFEFKLDNQGANDGYTQFGLSKNAVFSSLNMDYGVYFLNGRFHMFEQGSMHPRNHIWNDGDLFKIERIGNLTTLYINEIKVEDFISRETPALMINAYLRRYGFYDISITIL